jgi:hypothetical protein
MPCPDIFPYQKSKLRLFRHSSLILMVWIWFGVDFFRFWLW